MSKRPASSEYPEWYDGYVQSVPEGDIVELMSEQLKEVAARLNEIDEEKSFYRYSEGKWSIKELLGHLIDTERIMTYRALRFARKDKTDIPQYDHNVYVETAGFDSIPFDDMKKEFRFLRKATVMMFGNFTNEQFVEYGYSGGQKFTVRAKAYIIVGHVNHHLKMLRERYLLK